MLKAIILSGHDKSGKTTIKEAILKQTNDFFIIERGASDQWVYNGMSYNNEGRTDIKDCLEFDSLLKNVAMYVYLYADKKVLADRMFKHHEENLEFKLEKYDFIAKRFELYFSKTPIKVIKIDTGKFTADECANIILKEARGIQ